MSDISGATNATISMVVSGSAEELADLARLVIERIARGRLQGSVEFKPDYGLLSIDELLGYQAGVDNGAERPRNCLARAGIRTVAGLEGKTANDLMAITNFGQKSLEFLNMRLREHGLKQVL